VNDKEHAEKADWFEEKGFNYGFLSLLIGFILVSNDFKLSSIPFGLIGFCLVALGMASSAERQSKERERRAEEWKQQRERLSKFDLSAILAGELKASLHRCGNDAESFEALLLKEGYRLTDRSSAEGGGGAGRCSQRARAGSP